MSTTGDGDREAQAIRLLRERLIAKYDEIPPATVSAAVDSALSQFAGARIRDYVPLLVERSAQRELNSRARPHATVGRS